MQVSASIGSQNSAIDGSFGTSLKQAFMMILNPFDFFVFLPPDSPKIGG